jgi:hypothetical protein
MTEPWTDLYWLPVGAGGHCVRWNGRLYERLVASYQHRPACELYHSALQVHVDETTYAIEMGPVWNVPTAGRGVICEGPVGARPLGAFRAFRYEVRCWPDGCIPDLDEAVDPPTRVNNDAERATAILRVLQEIPRLTWGRDELGAGEMWNSNSLVSWALARTGHDLAVITPPVNGRAPGWAAGLWLADRQGAFSSATRSEQQGRQP